MRLLVDAQTVIWAVDDPSKLSPKATAALQDPANDLLLSASTIWEISIKVFPLPEPRHPRSIAPTPARTP